MKDPRILKTAEILVNYSTQIKKGDYVQILSDYDARDLILEIYKLCIKKGAYPIVKMGLPCAAYNYYKLATNKQLKHFPEVSMYEMKKTNAVIFVGSPVNTKELSNVDPEKMSIRQKTVEKISEERLKKKWVIFEYPTNALAQDAEMSLEEFEDFVFGATLVDWEKESKKQNKLKKVLDNGKKIQIIGEDTDLRFSIKGKKTVKCDGEFNMPDGEVFTEPVKNSVNGYIRYSFPAIYGGREVDGIKLVFKNGKVVKATAEKNEKFLKQMLKTDKGASYLGEFGVGVNYNIKRFVKQILFDEKIGGTVHFALGRAYKETGGENKSAIHWDMIKDLRKNGKIIIDDKIIQRNGKFLI